MVSARKERPKTRELIRWDEEKDIQILLGLVRICNQNGTRLPWDEVAQEIGPSVTGNAVVQHLAKLKKKRQYDGKSHKVPGGYKKVRGSKFGGKGIINSQDEQVDMDPDKGDPDESYGERKTKKRHSRGNKRIKHEHYNDGEDNENEGDDGDGLYKGLGEIPSKRINQITPHKRKKMVGAKNEEGSETETGPPKKAGRRQSNASPETQTDESDDGEGFVAAGVQFLGFNKSHRGKNGPKQRETRTHDDQEDRDVDSEDEREIMEPSKIISLHFNDRDALKKATSSFATSENDDQAFKGEDEALIEYGPGPYVSTNLSMHNMSPGMSMAQAGASGSMYAPGLQYGMFMNPFSPGVSQGLPAVRADRQSYFPTYHPSNAHMMYSPPDVRNPMGMPFLGGGNQMYRQQFQSFQTPGNAGMAGTHSSTPHQDTDSGSAFVSENVVDSNEGLIGEPAASENDNDMMFQYEDSDSGIMPGLEDFEA